MGKKTAQRRGRSADACTAPSAARPHKWRGELAPFPASLNYPDVDRWVRVAITWADLNGDDLMYQSYAKIVNDAAGCCLGGLALWKDCGELPRWLVPRLFALAQCLHWVETFWAGIPNSYDQKKANTVSAAVRGERRKLLIDFANSKGIPQSHAAKVYIEARKSGIIQAVAGKDYVMSPSGHAVGDALPDTQNPLKDILRK